MIPLKYRFPYYLKPFVFIALVPFVVVLVFVVSTFHNFADTLVDVREGLQDWLDAGFNM